MKFVARFVAAIRCFESPAKLPVRWLGESATSVMEGHRFPDTAVKPDLNDAFGLQCGELLC